MNLQQLKEQHEAIEKEIAHRLDIRSGLRQQIADAVCPFVVGDKVQREQTGELAIVHSINWLNYGKGYKITVKKIKKNGNLYLNCAKVWDSEKWMKI